MCRCSRSRSGWSSFRSSSVPCKASDAKQASVKFELAWETMHVCPHLGRSELANHDTGREHVKDGARSPGDAEVDKVFRGHVRR